MNPSSWPLGFIVGAVAISYLVLLIVFFLLAPWRASLEDLPCAVSTQQAAPTTCTEVEFAEDGTLVERTEQGSREIDEQSLESDVVIVFAPESERFTWAATGAFAIVLALVLFFPSLVWRSQLKEQFAEELKEVDLQRGRWYVRWNRILAVAFVVAVVLVFGGLLAIVFRGFGAWEVPARLSPISAIWLLGLPAIVSILDIHAIATSGGISLLSGTRQQIDHLRRLRRLLDLFLAVLGAALAGYVLWWGAVLQLENAIDSTLAAQQNMQVSGLSSETSVVVWGALLTALLGLAFGVAAVAVERVALRMASNYSNTLPWDEDRVGSKQRLDTYREEIGLERSLRERLQSGVLVAAPLLTALFAQLVGS